MKLESNGKTGPLSEPENTTKLDYSELCAAGQLSGLSRPNQRAFIAAFRVTGKLTEAAKHSNVARSNHYLWLATDKEYKRVFESSRDSICDHIEGALVEKLIFGWSEPVYQGGVLVGTKTKFDLNAMFRYLERVKPKIFGVAQEDLSATMAPVSSEIIEAIRQLRQSGQSVSNAEAAVAETAIAMEGRIESPEEMRLREEATNLTLGQSRVVEQLVEMKEMRSGGKVQEEANNLTEGQIRLAEELIEMQDATPFCDEPKEGNSSD